MCVRFILLACGTAVDVFPHKLGKAWPLEFSSNELVSFKVTRMPGGLMVMAMDKDRAMEGVLWGDIHTTFVCEDMVIIFLV